MSIPHALRDFGYIYTDSCMNRIFCYRIGTLYRIASSTCMDSEFYTSDTPPYPLWEDLCMVADAEEIKYTLSVTINQTKYVFMRL